MRQRSMKCDTQLLYGANGPTRVKEDGSCRANGCTLQGYVQMCMRSTPCSGDRHKTRIPTRTAEDTILGSYSVQHFTSPLHDDRRATTPRQQSNLRLTHLQCSQFTWSRNQGSVNLKPCCRFRHVCRQTTKFQVQTMVNDTQEL